MQAILASQESQNALKMGCFGTKHHSKMEKKCVFPKRILKPSGCTSKINESILSPFEAILDTLESQNALKMGCFGTKSESKMDQQYVFPEMILDHFGCPNK